MSTSESQLLLDYAYVNLTKVQLKDGARQDPAGPLSWWLRHFDVKIGKPEQSQSSDAWVEDRTLWVSPQLLSALLNRHKVIRERRQNGWMRMSFDVESLLMEMVVVALRGQSLNADDFFSLQSLTKKHIGKRMADQSHTIQVLSRPSFYQLGEAATVIKTQKILAPQHWHDDWNILFEAPWDKYGISTNGHSLHMPAGLPEQDQSTQDRARWLNFAVSTPELPSLQQPETAVQDVVKGFIVATQPLMDCKSLLPPFFFELRAHAYQEALKNQSTSSSHAAKKNIFGQDDQIKPNVRFACVLAVLDLLTQKGLEHQTLYEEALLAGLVNLNRNDG